MTHKIGLFFGSFDPVHKGHLEVVNCLDYSSFNEIWLMVTPENPFKKGQIVASFQQRIEMLSIAIAENRNQKKIIKICDLEAKLTEPYYTANTLAYLTKNFTESKFHLIMGADTFMSLYQGHPTSNQSGPLDSPRQWYKKDYILENFGITIYPRDNYCFENNSKFTELQKIIQNTKQTNMMRVKTIDLSSSQIREMINAGNMKEIDTALHQGVINYIQKNQLYIA